MATSPTRPTRTTCEHPIEMRLRHQRYRDGGCERSEECGMCHKVLTVRFRKLHPPVDSRDLRVFTYRTEKVLWVERQPKAETRVKRGPVRYHVLSKELKRRLREDEFVPPPDLAPARNRQMHETLVAFLEHGR